MVIRQQLAVDEFEQFIEQPQNTDRLFEYIGGEIVEVPSNAFVSYIASRISGFIFIFLQTHNIGFLTGEAGGYKVAGERYAPDVAFTSYTKQKAPDKEGYNSFPPDLAVEVVSSNRADEAHQLRIKVSNYLMEGTLVWVVRPEDKLVEVHEPGQPVKIYRMGDVLTGGTVLPGFTVKVDDIFEA